MPKQEVNRAMKILITGGKGMLGRTLVRRFADHNVVVADLPEVDITCLESITAAISTAAPEIVIHCAAMTAVDACEEEWDVAFRVNASGSTNVAIACHRARARLLAVSTDYVFAGDSPDPYSEFDTPAPRTVYGASKLAGEEAVREHCPDHCIVRIAWLYGPGGPSFYHTMCRLGSQSGAPLRVVDDQLGNPTSTDVVADVLRHLMVARLAGTFHATCEGQATWFEFARAIFAARGLARGLEPCTTAEFPRPAPRPANSRLRKMRLPHCGLPLPMDWREALERFVKEYPNE
jgi:dTDP-4-dehydrorhamnose reductase